MKHILFLFLLIASGVSGFGQVKSKAYNDMLRKLLDHSVTEVSVSDIDENDNSIVFLDAREKREYEVSHIKNAIWVGYDDFNLKRVAKVNKSKKIVVYCSVGYRSEKIAEKLLKIGYLKVANLYGSIFEWVNQGRPVYDKNENLTKEVHAYNKDWGKWLTKGVKVYK